MVSPSKTKKHLTMLWKLFVPCFFRKKKPKMCSVRFAPTEMRNRSSSKHVMLQRRENGGWQVFVHCIFLAAQLCVSMVFCALSVHFVCGPWGAESKQNGKPWQKSIHLYGIEALVRPFPKCFSPFPTVLKADARRTETFTIFFTLHYHVIYTTTTQRRTHRRFIL